MGLSRLLILAALAGAGATGALAQSAGMGPSGAVILMYHRFGEDAYPSTSIRLAQFEEHIAKLTSGPYHVLALEEVAAALRDGTPLPDRTVVITVDDAYRSIYTEAFPRLQAAGLPFTVFVNTDSVGQVPGALTWDELRTMEEAGVTIGAHSASHAHMAVQDRGAMEEDLARMTAAFLAELGHVPAVFAYPYGEYSAELVAMVEDAGYVAAFGQHSGVATAGSDMFTLPRFALNERYGAPDRFATIVDALPLEVSDVLPSDMLIQTGSGTANPPAIGFTVGESAGRLDRLACFASHDDGLSLELLGRRVEVRLARPFPPGRSRLNCTLPTADGRFRWYGMPFLVPGGED